MKTQPSFNDRELRETLRRKLNEIQGVEIGENPQRPNISLYAFAEKTTLQQLFAVLDWALEQIKK